MSRYSGYGPYVTAVDHGYSTAMHRLLLEADAVGADGVVGVQLSQTHLDHARGTREFMAIGTAVRATAAGGPNPASRTSGRTGGRPIFTTDLAGTDVAKLLLNGWIPVALQVGLEVAIRHDDYVTRNQAMSNLFANRNVEVSGYTELVHHSRAMARDKLARAIASLGADGGIVSDMQLHIWEIEPSDGHRDHVAEAMIVGTAIASFRKHHPGPKPLMMMSLKKAQDSAL
jgi:uncharacterized protein YbjQ (UPF0145 family)